MLCAELWELGTAGIEERPDGLRAFFEDDIHPVALSEVIHGLNVLIETNVPPIAVEEADDRDPILIGKRFVLVPANRIVLPIDAAMAFGSGRHETTQLCLEALEHYLQPGQTVYDVGCGSGILALAARKLGAGLVIASDMDEAAITVARRHFDGPLFVGSADCFPSHSADLVLCNITGAVNDHLAFDLKRIAKTSGLIVISGFTTETAPHRFNPAHRFKLRDWECWICNPSDTMAYESDPDQNSHKSQWWL